LPHVTLAVQKAGPVRTEQLMGRDFRVFPAIMVRSQVLNNNLGRTFLPEDAITQDWANSANSAPVVVDHPTSRGAAISARSPEVLNARGAGFLFNATAADGQLKADVFLDPLRAAAIPELTVIFEKLDKGETVELSTGFPVSVNATKGVHNGKEYDVVLTPGGFDHLAIFGTKVGACSIKDGCGLGINHEGPCENSTVPQPPVDAESVIKEPKWKQFLGKAARSLGFMPSLNESDDDRRQLITNALRARYAAAASSATYVWIESMDSVANEVVWTVEGDPANAGLFRATFEISQNGGVSIGDATKVRRVTEFRPVANASGDQSTEGHAMDRKQMIAQLVAAGPLDEAALNKLSDCQLKALAQPAANAEPQGDGWEAAHRYRAELEQLKAKTASAVENENKERARMLDDLLYNRSALPWSEQEIKAMPFEQLRKVHALAFPVQNSYTARGGPHAQNAGIDTSFVRGILDGPVGHSVLDGKKEAH
jgi:hypothetical protein